MHRTQGRGIVWTSILLAGACAGSVLAADQTGLSRLATNGNSGPSLVDQLQTAYPGVMLHEHAGRVTGIYGKPMTAAASPDLAAEIFLNTYQGIFDPQGLELELVHTGPLNSGKTVFAYKQFIDGLPVEYGNARVVVLNAPAGAENADRVVYVAGTLAKRPVGGFDAMTVEPDTAVQLAKEAFGDFPVWSNPELVVYFGDGNWTDARRAWKFTGEVPVLAQARVYTFFVDAATGEILNIRNDIHQVDVVGTVRGFATPGTGADNAATPPTLVNLDNIRVDLTGGGNTFTGELGEFLIANPGSSAVTLSVSLDNGQFVNIDDNFGLPTLSLSQSGILPPGNALFTFNATPTEGNTAQVNAFYHVNRIRDYVRSRSNFTAIDIQLTTNVNVNSTCNANFNPSNLTINFFRAGGGCNNTAFSSVVAHEYGHFIVNRLGLGQGGFGEGFSDTCSMGLFDDPIIGRNFFTTGGVIRTPDSANQQSPCTSTAVHTCGQIIGNVFWEMRKNMAARYGDVIGSGSGTGFSILRDHHVDWMQVTIGGTGTNFLNSAHPQTAIEWLTIDDNDGDLSNGTPHYNQICPAFAQSGIACPVVNPIIFTYPDGKPTLVPANQPFSFRFIASEQTSAPAPNTGRISYRIGTSGSYTTVNLPQINPNEYSAQLPAAPCGSEIQYFVSVAPVSGVRVTDPATAPTVVYSALVGSSVGTVAQDTFEIANGWTSGVAGDTATSGQWTRGNPIGTTAQPENDSNDAGDNCWFTGQGTVGGPLGEADVDGGTTTLLSRTYDLSTASAPKLSYWRWYSNDTGGAPNADTFVVQVSSNNGSTWQAVETVGPAGTGTSGGWIQAEFNLASLTTLTNQVRFRFIASDTGTGSLVEAAIDDVKITSIVCSTPCPADFTGDGFVDDADFVEFAQAYEAFTVPPALAAADLNGDLFVDDADFVIFAEAYEAFTCP